MSLPHAIMWAVVLVVGVPSAWRNPTAAALVLCWIAVETIFVLTGNNLAVQYYIYPDVFVLAVIAMKQHRSPADWAVIAIFPLMWLAYVATLDAYSKWWLLWYAALGQFLVAGLDSFLTCRRTRAVSHTPRPPGAEFQFAFARQGNVR